MADTKKDLRSAAWFGGNDRDGFIHRSWMRNQGFPSHLFERPVIGICNTWSELTPCKLSEGSMKRVVSLLNSLYSPAEKRTFVQRLCCFGILPVWMLKKRSEEIQLMELCC